MTRVNVQSNKYLGQVTVELTKFNEVIGIDPSQVMLTKAKDLSESSPHANKILFFQSKAEELDHLETGSVDMVTSGKDRGESVQNVLLINFYFSASGSLVQLRKVVATTCSDTQKGRYCGILGKYF